MRRRLLVNIIVLVTGFAAVSGTACYGEDDGNMQQDGGGDGGY